jgi:Tfp pilus assembly protein PilV
MNRRAGVTLIEVLIAIFVMALGLLALLTLFPLGALSMAQALKDDRVALTAANGLATLKAMSVANDTNVVSGMTHSSNNLAGDQPSYATFFDPIGMNRGLANQVGGPGVQRCTTTWLQQTFAEPDRSHVINSWFTSLDDLTFTNDGANMGLAADGQGQPAATGGPVLRAGAYSWGALLRRPHAGEVPVEVSIVVYSGRSTDPTPGTLTPAGETQMFVTNGPAAGSTIVTVNLPNGMNDIRVGSWILDNTNLVGHGDCYRVTAVTVNGNSADLELQTPLKVKGVATVVLMDNVAEVIYKGVIQP